MILIYDLLIVSVLWFFVIVIVWLLGYSTAKRMQRTIDRQNDTIKRLINREPVTYAETGQKQPTRVKESYAAWGSQMVNIDEDERR